MIGSLVVLVLASMVGVPSAAAQVCGNGLLELGESCDDGNTAAGDCCSSTCVLAPVGVVCRAAASPCDVAERCTGVLDVCPADSGPAPDSDGDGRCDPLDGCPTVSDPQPLDRDFDGIGDACDPCTNVAGAEIRTTRLRIRGLSVPAGNERIKLKGTFAVATTPVFDPIQRGMRFVVASADTTVIDVVIPPGELDPMSDPDERRGWQQRGTIYQYTDRAGTAGGIQRVVARQVGSDLRVMVLGRGGSYPLPVGEPEIVMTFVADPPTGQRQCADVVFGANRCRFKNAGSKLVCH